MNVGEIVRRVERQFLEHPDELWVRSRLTAPVDDVQTTIPIDLDLLGPEEQALLTVGVLVQVGFEQMIVTDVDNSTLTVTRGVRGTLVAEHDAGEDVVVAPPYTREVVFQAVSDAIVGMYPPLFGFFYTPATVGTNGITAIPTDTVQVQNGYRIADNSPISWQDLGMWPDADGNPVRSIRVFGQNPGEQVWLGFRTRFRLPEGPEDTLFSLGVREEWARIIVVGAAAQLIAAKPMSSAYKEYVSNQMRVEGYPVETPNRIRDALVAYHEFLINRAAASLHQQYPMMLNTIE
jgi:hypothetical protein